MRPYTGSFSFPILEDPRVNVKLFDRFTHFLFGLYSFFFARVTTLMLKLFRSQKFFWHPTDALNAFALSSIESFTYKWGYMFLCRCNACSTIIHFVTGIPISRCLRIQTARSFYKSYNIYSNLIKHTDTLTYTVLSWHTSMSGHRAADSWFVFVLLHPARILSSHFKIRLKEDELNVGRWKYSLTHLTVFFLTSENSL